MVPSPQRITVRARNTLDPRLAEASRDEAAALDALRKQASGRAGQRR
jgi:hypothetical protein